MNYLEECYNIFVYICNSARFPVNRTIVFVYTKALIPTFKPSFPNKKLYFLISCAHPHRSVYRIIFHWGQNFLGFSNFIRDMFQGGIFPPEFIHQEHIPLMPHNSTYLYTHKFIFCTKFQPTISMN